MNPEYNCTLSVLSGMEVEAEHCIIDHTKNEVTLQAIGDAACYVNGSCVDKPVKLTQGMLLICFSISLLLFHFIHYNIVILYSFYSTSGFIIISRSSEKMSEEVMLNSIHVVWHLFFLVRVEVFTCLRFSH